MTVAISNFVIVSAQGKNPAAAFTGTKVNASGEIVGVGGDVVSDSFAGTWQNGPVVTLSPLAGQQVAAAYGVNDSGLVVGASYLRTDFSDFPPSDPWASYAVEWSHGTAQALADLGYGGQAMAVDDKGQIVGWVTTAAGFEEAVLWNNGSMVLLGGLALPGYYGSSAAAVNDSAQVVGTSFAEIRSEHAFLWQNGIMTDLGTLTGGKSSDALDINDSGEIVGFGTDSSGVQRALQWVNGSPVALPGLSANGKAGANAINTSGIIVGHADTSAGVEHAVMWQDGQITDLNSLLPSGSTAVLTSAYDISDSGQIVGLETLKDGSTASVTFSIGAAAGPVTAAAALQSYQANPQIAALQVSDSAANVQAALSGLETVAQALKLLGIILTDSGIPTIAISASQLTSDAAALKAISGYFTLMEAAPSSSANITGATNALGNTLTFSDSASHYSITPNVAHTGFVISGDGITDNVSGVQALKFSDVTLIVAQTPGSSSAPTTGNITELYAAVFGRLPDVSGLAYYQNQLSANPAPLTAFAQQFLASPEYQNNSAHNYAQSMVGDTQFIADLYTNLLHRAPVSGDAAWYEENVIAPIIANAAPGTSAYSTALATAHAAVVTDFSQSSEFLSDVQITAQHPASAQYWLVLI